MWVEEEHWHGRQATKTYLFFKAFVSEIRRSWWVVDSDEIIISGHETDYGTAKHKAHQALLALTDGTA